MPVISLADAERCAGLAPTPGIAHLCRTGGEPEDWHLLTDATVLVVVNGLRVRTGLVTLRDRDELRVNGQAPWYFSTERLARIEPLPSLREPPACARCRQPMATGDPAVRCPRCGLWHHQSPALPCWSYAVTCAHCPQPTPESTGFRWVPERH
jgi:hypothetical protein